MSQLVLLQSASTFNDTEMAANYSQEVELYPGSTILLNSLHCNIQDSPNIVNIEIPTTPESKITYVTSDQTGSPQVTGTLTIPPNDNYDITDLIDVIRAGLVSSGSDGLSVPSTVWEGYDQQFDLNNNFVTWTTSVYPTSPAAFNNSNRWALLEGAYGSTTADSFTNAPSLTDTFDLLQIDPLPNQGFRISFTMGNCDEFELVLTSDDGTNDYVTITHQGDGNQMTLQYLGQSALTTAGGVSDGDQIEIVKVGNYLSLTAGTNPVLFYVTPLDLSEYYDGLYMYIRQQPNLNISLSDFEYNNTTATRTIVKMDSTFTKSLGYYLGFTNQNYKYQGNPAVLTSENKTRGRGNFYGVEVVIDQIPLRSYQGTSGKTLSNKNVLQLITNVVDNRIEYTASLPIALNTNVLTKTSLRGLTLKLFRNGQRLSFIGDAVASIYITNPPGTIKPTPFI